MKLGIMQPYFLPYLGYWQLIDTVDEFIIYDDADFSKGGWYNRNNIIVNNKKHLFTLPVEKAAKSKKINDKVFAKNIKQEKEKVLRKIQQAYAKSPHFEESYDVLDRIFQYNTKT